MVCAFYELQSKTSTMNAQTPHLLHQKNFYTPDYLKKGDTVVIVAPAGILKGDNSH